VGKVDFCNLYPLTFQEFLLACGEEKLLEISDRNDSTIMQAFKTKYMDYLKYYYYVRGNMLQSKLLHESKCYGIQFLFSWQKKRRRLYMD